MRQRAIPGLLLLLASLTGLLGCDVALVAYFASKGGSREELVLGAGPNVQLQPVGWPSWAPSPAQRSRHAAHESR